MNSVFDVLEELQRGGGASQLSKQLGADESATRSAVGSALPALIAALARNSQQPGGSEALLGALSRDHDGSILGDLLGAVAGGGRDGEGILGHVLGGRRAAVEQEVGRRSGLDPQLVSKLLVTLAPLVLGALGRARREKSLDARGLEDMLGRERREAEVRAPGGLGPLDQILGGGGGNLRDGLTRIGGGLLRRWLSRRGR